MKIFKIVALFLVIISKSFASSKSIQGYPDIEFRYAHIFDSICWQGHFPGNTNKWIAELYSSLPTFSKGWKDEGEPLLEETIKQFKKKFKRKEMIASVFLCENYPSIGTPLLVKAVWYLNSPMKGKPLKLELFLSNVFHELLHTYLEENFSSKLVNSKLALALAHLAKGESTTTITHLHLMAIMKSVYLNTDQKKLLGEIVEFEGRFALDYKRAWEIIETEGYEPYLKELM